MKERSEAVAMRALGRTREDEDAALREALAEDPELARELRKHEDELALAWQAASPLRRVPGRSLEVVLARIREEREAAARRAERNEFVVVRPPVWRRALPWAAALAFAALYFTKNPKTTTVARENDEPVREREAPAKWRERSEGADRTLATMMRMRRQIEGSTVHDQRAVRPLIRPLYAPGTDGSAIDPGKARNELLALLTEALAVQLRRADEQPADVVIEHGWLPDLFPAVGDERVVRHRDLPAELAAELGLLVSRDGASYYDEMNGLLWEPAADGGGHLGRRVPEGFDASGFAKPEIPEQRVEDVAAEIEAKGYLVGDPETGEETLVMTGATDVEPGSVRIVTTDGGVVHAPWILTGASQTSGPIVWDLGGIPAVPFSVVGNSSVSGEPVELLVSP